MNLQSERTQIKQLDDPPDFTVVDQVMASFGYREEGLIDVLITAQESYGHLSRDLLKYIARKLKVPLSRVYGVVTFYDMLTLEPAGQRLQSGVRSITREAGRRHDGLVTIEFTRRFRYGC